MKILSCIILILLVTVLGTRTQAETWQSKGWEGIGEYKDVRSYRLIKEKDGLKSLGGEGIIDASIDRILSLLFDVNHTPDWVFRAKSASILEQSSDLKQSIQYLALGMPFPFSDRDFVVKYQVLVESKTGAVSILVEPAEHATAPKTVGIRAQIRGRYDFTPLGKDQVLCHFELFADPGGMLPDWVIHMLQQRWPIVTLLMMREAASHATLVPLPQYRAWIQP